MAARTKLINSDKVAIPSKVIKNVAENKRPCFSEEEARQIWSQKDCVCFDVDSTVCMEEGLDELAEYLGVGEEVKAWTKKGMAGNVSFSESLSNRLEIIKPSFSQIQKFLEDHPLSLTPGIEDLISQLQADDIPVYLVSGGFCEIIEPLAIKLKIPMTNVFANRFIFNEKGEYVTFDFSIPTSQSGGKGVVLKGLKDTYTYKMLAMIGDGFTDYEAFPPADVFIGYGGNVVREEVKALSPLYIYNFSELLN